MILPCLFLVFLVEPIPESLGPGLGPGLSPWQSPESGPLEWAVFVSVSASLRRKGPLVTALSGSWARSLAGEDVDTNWVYPWSLKNAGHRATVMPSAFQSTASGQLCPAW